VKPRTDPRVQSDRGLAMRVATPAASRSIPLPEPGAAELEVLECLGQAGTGLTVGQLEARLPSLVNVQAALDLLMERRLAARLNTIVPSYTCRRADAGVHAE
jgi:hypothetical protein